MSLYTYGGSRDMELAKAHVRPPVWWMIICGLLPILGAFGLVWLVIYLAGKVVIALTQ